MMHRLITTNQWFLSRVLLILVLSFASIVSADDDETSITSTLSLQHGKVTGEREEIEIYDYHTGTFQSVYVYRKPIAESKQPETSTLPAVPMHDNKSSSR